MKRFALAVFMMLGMSVTAQKQVDMYNTFFRVYDLNGKKIAKGKAENINHNTLFLKNNSKSYGINYQNIGYIKTKRSVPHTVLVTSTVALVGGAVVGAAVTDPDKILDFNSKEEGALAYGVTAGLIGSGLGALGGLIKNSQTIYIQGDPEAWKAFIARFKGINPDSLMTMSEDKTEVDN